MKIKACYLRSKGRYHGLPLRPAQRDYGGLSGSLLKAGKNLTAYSGDRAKGLRKDKFNMLRKIFTVTVVVLTIFWAVGLAAFVPTAQATTLTSGDLIKAALPAVYYYGADGKRYVFPNEKTYKTWYADFSGVKTITDGELAAITIGGNVTSKPGVKMGKITTDPKVYAISANGTLRWVSTASIAACLYGANWGTMIDDISDAFFVNYTIGSSITDCTQYSPSAAVAAAQSINVDKGLAGISTTGGNLQISLAADTPASATIAVGASANMTKVTFAAGATAVKIKSMYITRGGLSTNDDIDNIKLVAASGATVGGVGSLGSNSKALLTFVPNLELAANTSVSYFIRASVNAPAAGTTNAGNTVALAIALNTDIVLEGGTVTGSFPVTGNYMSIIELAGLGSATVGQDAAVVDSKPDAGQKRVLTSEFYVQAGANENITVESLSLIEAGSANTSDSAVIELYSLTEGRTLGTVSAWDANARATYGGIGIVIPKGAKHIFQVYTDIIGGSGLVIDVDLTDGSDVLASIKGNTYGFYLTPAINPPAPAAPWQGQGIDGIGGQTVNPGTLTVSKSVATPAVGNIAKAAEQPITTWDLEVRGEEIKVTGFMVTLALGGTLTPAMFANAKLVDETGIAVAGPKNIVDCVVGGPLNICFTDTMIVPTGTHKYTFKIDVLSTALVAGGNTVGAAILNPAVDIAGTGMTTRDTITPTPAALVAGNLQTILGVNLSVTTLTQPASRQVAVGTQNYVWATAALDASGSGEDVRVSSVTITNTFVDANAGAPVADSIDLQNIEIWADLTTASSDRGDAYETKISNSEQAITTVAAKAIALTQVITVAKGTNVKIAVVADLASGADALGAYPANDNYTVNVSAVTATGKATGNVPGTVYSGAGQQMFNSGAGVLTVVTDASSPLANILVSGAQKQTVAVFKLSASKIENLDLDDVTLTEAALATGLVGQNIYLYSSLRSDSGSIADPIGLTTFALTPGAPPAIPYIATFVFADNTVVIPANSSVTLTAKIDVAPVDGITVVNGDTTKITVAAAGDINTTGKSSGLIVPNLGAVVTAATNVAFASKPTITLNAASPSGALVPSANTLVAIFNIAADSADDISFDDAGSAGSQIVVTMAEACTAAGGATNMILKDEGGTVLSTAAEGADACSVGNKTFATWAVPLVIAKGTTKKVYVYGVTTSATTAGDNLQASITDVAAGNVTWGINGAGAFPTANITARGTIYANALSR